MSGAFAAGAGFTAGQLGLLIAGLGCALVLLWAAWALLSAWYGWSRTRVTGEQLQRAGLRIGLLTVVILWILV